MEEEEDKFSCLTMLWMAIVVSVIFLLVLVFGGSRVMGIVAFRTVIVTLAMILVFVSVVLYILGWGSPEHQKQADYYGARIGASFMVLGMLGVIFWVLCMGDASFKPAMNQELLMLGLRFQQVSSLKENNSL